MNGVTRKCPACGRAYKVMPFYTGDQSACRACVAEAERAAQAPDTPEQIAPGVLEMTFRDLLDALSDTEILDALIAQYPDVAESREGYCKALTELRATVPAPKPDCGLLIRFINENTGYFDLTYVEAGEEYSPSFAPWAEMLGMPITSDTDLEPAQIAAIMLWEVTFHGFSMEAVQRTADELKRIADEVDAALASLPENPTEADYEAVGLKVFDSEKFISELGINLDEINLDDKS